MKKNNKVIECEKVIKQVSKRCKSCSNKARDMGFIIKRIKKVEM